MKRVRLMVIGAVLALAFAKTWPVTVQAQQTYPAKPITLILPYEAGSGTDLLTRPLAELASKKLGVPIIVINKVGAASVIGMRELYGAKPDG